MAYQIQTSGKIINQQSQNGELIENRDFQFQTLFKPSGAEIEQEFSLSGQPGQIKIDKETGEISGNVKSLHSNGKKTTSSFYPEFDYRKYKDVTPQKQSYDFSFDIICKGKDQIGTQTVSWEVKSNVTITVLKDFQVNALLFQRKYLDGDTEREQFTCWTGYPTTEQQCNKIGGNWDGEKCDINIPKTQSICESVGGVWERGQCNMQMIETKKECEDCGHIWTKNSFNGKSTFSKFLESKSIDSKTVEIYNEVKDV